MTAPAPSAVRIHARWVLRTLLVFNAVLIAGFLITKFFPTPSRAINRAFDLSAEASIPAWYSGCLLLSAGLLALVRAMQLRASDVASHWKAYVLLGAGLVFLSADEVAQIHETLSGTMHRRAGVETGAMADVEIWDLVTAAVYAAGGLFMFALLRRDMFSLLRESRGRTALIGGGIVFVLGAVAVDQLHIGVTGQTASRIRVALEDGMELTGAALMLYGLLVKVAAIQLQIVAAPARQPANARSAEPIVRPSPASPLRGLNVDDDDLTDLVHS